MEFEPEALVAVELSNHQWVRFTLVGKITGGSLKTKDQADKESIQGAWLPADTTRLTQEVKLRAPDIIKLIKIASKWYETRPYICLPVPVGHVSSSLRLLLVHDDRRVLRVLVAKEGGGSTRLPISLCSHQTIGQVLVDNTIKVRDDLSTSFKKYRCFG